MSMSVVRRNTISSSLPTKSQAVPIVYVVLSSVADLSCK